MSELTPQTEEEALAEAALVRDLRARRDAELTPTERLERVHELCRQLAAIEVARPPER